MNIVASIFEQARGLDRIPKPVLQAYTPRAPRFAGKENDDTTNIQRLNKENAKPSRLNDLNKGVSKAPRTPQPVRSRPQGVRPTPLRLKPVPHKERTPVTPSQVKGSGGIDVNVVCRMRPPKEDERCADITVLENSVVAKMPNNAFGRSNVEKRFAFSKVFDEATSQQSFFDEVGMPILKKFINGVDSVLFSYGAGASGKTHTILGKPGSPGLLPRMFKTVLASNTRRGYERCLSASCIEIRNKKVFDVLSDKQQTLMIGRDALGFTVAKGASEMDIKSAECVDFFISSIDQARKRSNTGRSHCIYTLKLTQTLIDSETGRRSPLPSMTKCTRLSIVDLAPSERIGSIENDPRLAAEISVVNSSLSTLSQCIKEAKKASAGTRTVIPFRNSKLTELFRDFFDFGDRKTAVTVIVNIAPNLRQFDDTIFALQLTSEYTENISSSDIDDDNFAVQALTFEDEELPCDMDLKLIREADARIRQEIRSEMYQEMFKIQDKEISYYEAAKANSATPHTTDIQQIIAKRLKDEKINRELETALDEKKKYVQMLEEKNKQIEFLKSKVSETERCLKEILEKNTQLEEVIKQQMAKTKIFHESQVSLQRDLQSKAEIAEKLWLKKIGELQSEIRRLRSQ